MTQSPPPSSPRPWSEELAEDIDGPRPSGQVRSGARDDEFENGLIYVHRLLGDRIMAHRDLRSHVYALTELMIAKGLIGLDEFEDKKRAVSERMDREAALAVEGAAVLPDDRDKYAMPSVEIDCQSRMHLCKASCCRLSFHLSKQDLAEHTVRWDVTRPYHIEQREDGYCVHCDPSSNVCDVHAQRPMVCRQYDCRNDERIWEDFDAMRPSQAVLATRRLPVVG